VNILFVCEVDWIDKVVFEMHSLAETLSGRGHTVIAIDHRNDPQSWETMETISRTGTGPILLRRPRTLPVNGLDRIWATYTHYHVIKDTIERFNIDAIVLYSVPTNGLQTVLLAKKFNIPVIFRSLDKLHAITKTKWVRPIVKALEKAVYNKSDVFLSINTGLINYAINLGAKPRTVDVLPIMVDDTFRPNPQQKAKRLLSEVVHNWPMDTQIILFMGSIHWFSGLDIVVRDMLYIMEKAPKARLLIVGDGPYKEELDDLINRLDLNEYIIRTGLRPYAAMPHYINIADICICPFRRISITKEILPSKIIQYMACAKPVVCENLPGVKQLISDNTVKYRGYGQSISDAIIELLNDQDQANARGQRGFRYVLSTNTPEAVATQLEEHIKEAINDKRK